MTTQQILFIDSRVAGYEALIASLDAKTRWHVLDAQQDGMAQIERLLTDESELDTIHIISHGAPGTLHLGSTVLTSGNLSEHAQQLQSIGSRLTVTGDILLYGCDVAQGEEGQAFVNALADLTGADVAASDDLTGGAPTSGNLDLEVRSDQIGSEIAVPMNYPFLLIADTTAPTLKSLTFPTTIDVSGGNAPVTFAAQANDTASAIDDVVVWFDKDLTYELGSYRLWGLFSGWDDSTPNDASATWTVSRFNNPGTYNITAVDVTDMAGNKRSYTPAELATLGINTSFTVTDGSPTPTNGMTVVGSRTGDFIDLKISVATWSESSNSISFKLDYNTTDMQWVSASPGSTGAYALSTSATSTGNQGTVRISGSISNNGDNTEFLHLRFSLAPGATAPFDYSFTNVSVNNQSLSPIAGSLSFEDTNTAPIGWVTIKGTATQGVTLTATNTLADADGLGTISYQWNANGAAISGATGSSYTLTQAEVGKTISVTASYTDGKGTAESKTSVATMEVSGLNMGELPENTENTDTVQIQPQSPTENFLQQKLQITLNDALQWVVEHLDNPQAIYDICLDNGIRNDMLAEIVQPHFSGSRLTGADVDAWFKSQGVGDSAEKPKNPTEDFLQQKFQITSNDALQWVIQHLDNPQAIYDVSASAGINSQMLAEIMQPHFAPVTLTGTVVNNWFAEQGVATLA